MFGLLMRPFCIFFDGQEPTGGTGEEPTGDKPVEKSKAKAASQVPPAMDDDDDGDDDLSTVKAMQAEIKRLRQENAKHRTNAKTERSSNDRLKIALAKELGLEVEDATPEQLTKQLAETRNKLRSVQVESVFNRVANQLDADPELTLAVLQKRGLLKDLDPEDEDFERQLGDMVKSVVKANPKLKAGVQPNKTGTEFKDGSKPNQPDMGAWLRRKAGLG